MRGARRGRAAFHPEMITDFLNVIHDFDRDDTWLLDILIAARAVAGWVGPGHAVTYDVSDPLAFRVEQARTLDFSEAELRCLRESFGMVSPELSARSFRSLLTHSSVRELSSPELDPLFAGMQAARFAGLPGDQRSRSGGSWVSGGRRPTSHLRSRRSATGAWHTTWAPPTDADGGCGAGARPVPA
jgi:hypothetical protein